jgi:hypothetical protein
MEKLNLLFLLPQSLIINLAISRGLKIAENNNNVNFVPANILGQTLDIGLNLQIEIEKIYGFYTDSLQIAGRTFFDDVLFFNSFFKCCRSADIIILNNWLPKLNMNNFFTRQDGGGYAQTNIIKPKKSSFAGVHEMQYLAEHIIKIAPQAELYSLAWGGSWEESVHKYAQVIYSFNDPNIKNLKKIA